jgi:GTP-binding protein
MGHHAPPGRRLTDAVDTLLPDTEAAEAARRLFAQECRFFHAAAAAGALPAESLPEIAFAGRSNVGKSSLINALTGRSRLARTSNTPGRTRQLNFFDLGGRLILVDLPGYGYAEASKNAIRAWTDLMQRYLRRRATLRRLCLLIDARHGIKEIDRPLMALLDASGVSFQLVLTKSDKPKAAELSETVAKCEEELAAHPAAHSEIHLTSARDGSGIAALRATLAGFAIMAPAAQPH